MKSKISKIALFCALYMGNLSYIESDETHIGNIEFKFSLSSAFAASASRCENGDSDCIEHIGIIGQPLPPPPPPPPPPPEPKPVETLPPDDNTGEVGGGGAHEPTEAEKDAIPKLEAVEMIANLLKIKNRINEALLTQNLTVEQAENLRKIAGQIDQILGKLGDGSALTQSYINEGLDGAVDELLAILAGSTVENIARARGNGVFTAFFLGYLVGEGINALLDSKPEDWVDLYNRTKEGWSPPSDEDFQDYCREMGLPTIHCGGTEIYIP